MGRRSNFASHGEKKARSKTKKVVSEIPFSILTLIFFILVLIEFLCLNIKNYVAWEMFMSFSDVFLIFPCRERSIFRVGGSIWDVVDYA